MFSLSNGNTDRQVITLCLPSGLGPGAPQGSLGPSSATCGPWTCFTQRTSVPLLLHIPWLQSSLSYATAGHASASSSSSGSRPGSLIQPQALDQSILLISWLQARLLHATAGSKPPPPPHLLRQARLLHATAGSTLAPPPHLLAPVQAPPHDRRH